MKILKFLPILVILILGNANPSSAQVGSCTFQSPLRYNGTQWQVASIVGPVYLARLEGGAWRILAVFDGVNGKYHLNWDEPTKGTYAALDTFGVSSDSKIIGDDRDREMKSYQSRLGSVPGSFGLPRKSAQ